MGKYGNGVNMKSVIEMEYAEVKDVLDKYKMAEADKVVVLDALQGMAYQWCHSNANACAYERCVPYKKNPLGLISSKKFQEEYKDKMEKTYPWYGEGEE